MNTERRKYEKPVRKQKPTRAGSLYARNALVVGLTGGIATGKTTVADMFKHLGAKVVSADEIVHEMLQPGSETSCAIAQEFGDSILKSDRSIDRLKLAEIIFNEKRKRLRLEKILHPPVIARLAEEAERFRNEGEGVLILEIPLLVETASMDMVDIILVVTAEQETQIERLYIRYGLGRREAVLRIESQLPMSEKLKYAEWVIDTEGTLQDTRIQVKKVWDTIQKSLAQRR